MSQRVVVVGVSSLLGREIAEALNDGPLAAANVVLLDSEAEPGKLEDIGGEAAVLQPVEPASFEDADIVIFATAADAGKYWSDALRWGAAAVDATGTVQGLPVLSPRLGQPVTLSLAQSGIAAAQPAATMLAAVLLPLQNSGLLRSAFGTVLQPVSENGASAVDELHQQTVSLLSFQRVPSEQHDVQVAFNILPRFGEDAKFDLTATERLVDQQLRSLIGSEPMPVLQWLQAPVFHGYGISLFVVLSRSVEREELEALLKSDLLEWTRSEDTIASNTAAAGQDRVIIDVALAEENILRIWMVADNLKLLAQTAVGCAAELLRMRPSGIVQ